MSTARILKWISGILEAVLAIPVLGGLIVLGNGYAPLGVMLILHIITMAVSSQAGVKKHGSILGIITSCLGWIPVLGWILHAVTAIALILDAAKSDTQVKAD
ncbi:hypothetical protein ACFQ49_13750 [Kroppenstedtia eburnea]|uniref:Uncharacterized protein n=1 Tax=Kroppenstedtia eburnea TaxID=714067 RepID=A0A1N7LM95_9BACL|nr:hypothetical protein [Kroppenstedtia eburnea]EGK08254.1 hypothetical protein HMPREF9374_3462 [Desmospora sp. 8437]QKI81259.1 hypothetical protein GXN75_04185 [Kroppenstedtia eburnea]SIS74968.1 hypothetical protein SAMN05421790_104266 [Kroppenstedtia eburnea]